MKPTDQNAASTRDKMNAVDGMLDAADAEMASIGADRSLMEHMRAWWEVTLKTPLLTTGERVLRGIQGRN